MNHSADVTSVYRDALPSINREQLPAVVLRSLPESFDASRAKKQKDCVSDSSTLQCLKPLTRDSEEPPTSSIIDLECFQSLFRLPLDYLWGVLIAAYQGPQKGLNPKAKPVSMIDVYV